MSQNFSNHRQMVPMYHYFVFLLVLSVLIGSFVNFFESLRAGTGVYSASLITAIGIIMVFNFFFIRIFALKAQDRAIRAEENLRHYVLTGKLLDAELRTKQIVALRFASDSEFPTLASKARINKMSGTEIKKNIKNWRADFYRV